jgi:hypothetical protein
MTDAQAWFCAANRLEQCPTIRWKQLTQIIVPNIRTNSGTRWRDLPVSMTRGHVAGAARLDHGMSV